MNFFFKGYFWSIILILAGTMYLINNIFHIKIPVVSIILALLLILLGVQLLVGQKGSITGYTNSHNVIFNESNLEADDADSKYNVIFGKGTIDLTQIASKTNTKRVEASVVFGQGTIKIKKTDPIRIKASCVFGNLTLPDGSAVSFGDRTFETESYAGSDKGINLKVDVVFGDGLIVLTE